MLTKSDPEGTPNALETWSISAWPPYAALGNRVRNLLKSFNLHVFIKGDLCLVHLPGQNIFCPVQYLNCPGQKFCPGLKSPFFALKSHSK